MQFFLHPPKKGQTYFKMPILKTEHRVLLINYSSKPKTNWSLCEGNCKETNSFQKKNFFFKEAVKSCRLWTR